MDFVKVVIISVFQSAFLAVAQLLLKMGLDRVTEAASMTWGYIKSYINVPLLSGVASYSVGIVLWFYLLKKYPLNLVYPLTSISYIFTAILGIIFLKEQVSIFQWIGILLIMAGVACFAK